MKINGMQMVEANGGQQYLHLSVANGGSLKSIVVSSESITGYSISDVFNAGDNYDTFALWSTVSWNQLVKFIGIDTSMQVLRYYNLNPLAEDYLLDEGALLALKNLTVLAIAAQELQHNWEVNYNKLPKLETGYPFDESFEEIAAKIEGWHKAVVKAYNK